MESWRAKLLHRKLRLRGYDAALTPVSSDGDWQVILPIATKEGALQQIHFDRAVHNSERELRTVKLRDVTGVVRTVRLHDVADQYATMTVSDVDGHERTFRVKVKLTAPATPLEHKQGMVQALRAMHECSWLLSGRDRFRLHHPQQPSTSDQTETPTHLSPPPAAALAPARPRTHSWASWWASW